MSDHLPSQEPDRFGLTSFADMLPDRHPIVGEEPGSFDGFHGGMMRTLAPMTPYECVIAENLIAIEWELIQHRRMRDASLRGIIRARIKKAVVELHRFRHEVRCEEAWNAHVEAGGTEDDWQGDPFEFDRVAAEREGVALASRAMSRNPDEQAAAYADIVKLGMEPVDLMSEAFDAHSPTITKHENKLIELEKRRREVKRDYDALQANRPIEGEIVAQ